MGAGDRDREPDAGQSLAPRRNHHYAAPAESGAGRRDCLVRGVVWPDRRPPARLVGGERLEGEPARAAAGALRRGSSPPGPILPVSHRQRQTRRPSDSGPLDGFDAMTPIRCRFCRRGGRRGRERNRRHVERGGDRSHLGVIPRAVWESQCAASGPRREFAVLVRAIGLCGPGEVDAVPGFDLDLFDNARGLAVGVSVEERPRFRLIRRLIDD